MATSEKAKIACTLLKERTSQLAMKTSSSPVAILIGLLLIALPKYQKLQVPYGICPMGSGFEESESGGSSEPSDFPPPNVLFVGLKNLNTCLLD